MRYYIYDSNPSDSMLFKNSKNNGHILSNNASVKPLSWMNDKALKRQIIRYHI